MGQFCHIILGAGLFRFCSKITVCMQTRATEGHSFCVPQRQEKHQMFSTRPYLLAKYFATKNQHCPMHEIAPPYITCLLKTKKFPLPPTVYTVILSLSLCFTFSSFYYRLLLRCIGMMLKYCLSVNVFKLWLEHCWTHGDQVLYY